MRAVPDTAFKSMKMFNFDSVEDVLDVNGPSIETADMDMRRLRCKVETDGDVDLCSGW